MTTPARDPEPTPGKTRAKRLQIENMAVSVDERTDGIYATLRSGTVDRWVRVEKDLFELTSSEPCI